jgi:DNA (cytosine-5)-methyltransferase 1
MTIEILDKAEYIISLREKLGLGPTELANLLGLNSTGERTVRGWEKGEHEPTQTKWKTILELESTLQAHYEQAPFRQLTPVQSGFTFIDLFAGIGGIRLPFQKLGGHCVFTSEWDKFAQKTYLANYGEMPNGDITQIQAKNIPKHDILLGGFPCQSFSQAGLGKGFDDTRGTMFFEIQRILTEKRPKAFLLENVKQLRAHDKGRTLETILGILRGEHEQEISDDVPMSEDARHALSKKLNYSVDVKVLRAGDFGVPQNRERIFIIGFDRDYFGNDLSFKDLFTWPVGSKEPTRVGEILQDLSELPDAEDKFTISDRLWAGHQKRKDQHKTKGNGFGYTMNYKDDVYTNTISARYYKDGSEILINQDELGKNPRKLTPRECARLQGFPEDFIVDAVSQGQIYKQFGNSVCMKVIEAVAAEMVKTLEKAKNSKSQSA